MIAVGLSGCVTYAPSERAGYPPASRRDYPSQERYGGPEYTISRVVIDPGHGGKDPGTVGRTGIYEKTIVLDIAKRLKRKLASKGITAILTRDKDTFISLKKRSDIANKQEADFFISIHANAFRNGSVKGFETYYLSEAVDDSARAIAQAENASVKFENSGFDYDAYACDVNATVLDMIYTENRAESVGLAQHICKEARKTLWVRNRGVKSAKFYVLKCVRIPAVLVEVGFLSNRSEEAKLSQPKYRDKVASALSKGILSYKREFEETDGFTR